MTERIVILFPNLTKKVDFVLRDGQLQFTGQKTKTKMDIHFTIEAKTTFIVAQKIGSKGWRIKGNAFVVAPIAVRLIHKDQPVAPRWLLHVTDPSNMKLWNDELVEMAQSRKGNHVNKMDVYSILKSKLSIEPNTANMISQGIVEMRNCL